MTSYNGAPFLEQQLSSIEAQHDKPEILVVVDDGSTDDSAAVVERFASTSSVTTVLVRHDRNEGLRASVTEAVLHVDCDVVVLADQDDVWEPEKIAVVRAAFADPAVQVWFSDAQLVDESGRSLGRSAWEAVSFDATARQTIDELGGLRRLIHASTVTGATMAVSRRLAQVALPMPAGIGRPSDDVLHDGWLALMGWCLGGVRAEPRRLVHYRQHSAQVTSMAMLRANPRVTRDEVMAALELETSRVRLALDRLDERGVRGSRRDDVHRWLVFLTARAAALRARRVAGVVRLWRAGSYHEWAHGRRTVAIDLLRCLRGLSQ